MQNSTLDDLAKKINISSSSSSHLTSFYLSCCRNSYFLKLDKQELTNLFQGICGKLEGPTYRLLLITGGYSDKNNLYIIYGMDFENLFLSDPVVLSLSLVPKTRLNEIHERSSGKTCLSGSDLSPASLLDFLVQWLTFTSWCSPVVAFQLGLRQLWFSYCKAFEENIDSLVEVALITYGFFIKRLDFLGSWLNSIQEFLLYPSLQVIPYSVVLKSK